MKQFLLLIFSFSIAIEWLYAQSATEIRAYITKYTPSALAQEREYGIPATITLAQGILESGAGTSQLTVNTNNHFGIKALKGWDGKVYYAWDDEPVKSKFRVYASPEDSFRDHSLLLKNASRYAQLFSKSVYDYRAWAFGLQTAGYATASNYAKALIGYIEAFSLYEVNGGVKLKAGKTITITTVEVIDTAEKSESSPQELSEEAEEVNYIVSRHVVQINDVRCSVLYPGQTLSQLAQKYDISKQKLLEYNELTSEKQLAEGDLVFLQKKKNRFGGIQEYYRVKEGDSLYSISQMFGIRLASLAKMNKRHTFSQVKLGEKIKIK